MLIEFDGFLLDNREFLSLLSSAVCSSFARKGRAKVVKTWMLLIRVYACWRKPGWPLEGGVAVGWNVDAVFGFLDLKKMTGAGAAVLLDTNLFKMTR